MGLAHTWYGVMVVHGGDPIGMGRIIGDGGCFFQIVDICVLPEHQGHGLGRRIMQALNDELERRAPATLVRLPHGRRRRASSLPEVRVHRQGAQVHRDGPLHPGRLKGGTAVPGCP